MRGFARAADRRLACIVRRPYESTPPPLGYHRRMHRAPVAIARRVPASANLLPIFAGASHALCARQLRSGRLSMSWLSVLFVVIAALSALFWLVVYLGGIPPVHEWSSAFRGSGK